MVKRDTGITLTMNEFRTAMKMCGYLPVNPQKIDCYYRISKKSPVLQDEWRIKYLQMHRSITHD